MLQTLLTAVLLYTTSPATYADTTLGIAFVKPDGTQWPAWIQAVGSLIGIVIAIAVPYCIQRQKDKAERDEWRRRGHALAVQTRELVEEWYGRWEEAGLTPHEYSNGGAIALLASLFDRKNPFFVPPLLLSAVPNLHYLDQAGEILLTCIYKNHELKMLWGKLCERARNSQLGDAELYACSAHFFPEYARQRERFEEALFLITNRFDQQR